MSKVNEQAIPEEFLLPINTENKLIIISGQVNTNYNNKYYFSQIDLKKIFKWLKNVRNWQYHTILKGVLCLVAQSCPTLCNPKNYSLPGSSVHGDSPGKNTGVSFHALL